MISATPHQDAAGMDREHHVQIGLAKVFCRTVEQKGCEAGRDVLDQLVAYTAAHFLSEELLMRLYAYGDYDSHVMDHERMMENFHKLQADLAQGDKALSLSQAEELLAELLRHIGSRDVALHNYLEKLES